MESFSDNQLLFLEAMPKAHMKLEFLPAEDSRARSEAAAGGRGR